MRIIHLSDSHLSRDKPARTAEFEASIKFINALQPAADVVVHTGDVAHDGTIEEYEIAKGLLDQLSVPYFVLAGNRDNRQHLTRVFADGRHLRSDMPFVQYVVDDFALQMFMLDTVCQESNKGEFCEARRRHLDEMISANPDRPSVAFLHHPPFPVGVGPEPHNFREWAEAEALMTLLRGHKNLRGVYAGHVHRRFETSIGSLPACVVSCIASDLRWDKPQGPDGERPVLEIRTLSAKSGRPVEEGAD